MNIHHVHQQDEHHFIKCSNPACDVTINRMRKYYLLRTKEDKVMEMYEQAVKSHDNILKRRQSIDVSHLSVPATDANYENFLNKFSLSPAASPKHRRFSVPNKPKPSDPFRKNRSVGDLEPLNESTHDGNYPKETSNKKPPHPYSSRSLPLTASPKDMNDYIGRRSSSMTNLSTRRISCNENNKVFLTPPKTVREPRSISPQETRHLEAKKRLDDRNSLINSLETDIRKVDNLLRRMKVRSMPILVEPNATEIEINIEEPSHELTPLRCLSSEA